MAIKRNSIIGGVIFIFCSNAFATPGVTTTINYLRVTNTGTAILYINTPLTTSTCATNTQLNFNASTDGGKAMLSVALAAKAQNKSVYIESTANCVADFVQLNVN